MGEALGSGADLELGRHRPVARAVGHKLKVGPQHQDRFTAHDPGQARRDAMG